MLLITLKVLFRYIKKNATIALINIVSYGLGIAACLILGQYILFETSYDKFYKDHQNIYRISMDQLYSGVNQSSTALTFIPLGPELKTRYREVEAFTAVQNRLEVVTVDDKNFFEKRVLVADTNYFKVFSLDIIKGTAERAVSGDIFIAEAAASKYFGPEDPLGKTIRVFRNTYTVKGVYKNLPASTHLKFDILCLVPVRTENDWNVPLMYTFVKLNVDGKTFANQLHEFSVEFSKLANKQSEGDYSFEAKLQPLTSIHLQSSLLNEFEMNGRLEDIKILSVIVMMILMITCFNYINLSNAINAARVKEVFVRKIHGASRWNTTNQQLAESLAINFFGFTVAALFMVAFVKWIGPFYDFPYVTLNWSNPSDYVITVAIILLAITFSTLVPSFLTPSFKSVKFFSRASGALKESTGFSKNIAFVQFAISTVLISGALVVLRQINFMMDGDRGFSDKGVLALEINPLNYQRNEDAFVKVRNDLLKIASIEDVSFSHCVPGEQLINTSVRLSTEAAETTKNCDIQVVTSDYFSVYQIELIEGRVFAEDNPADVASVIVNESLARLLLSGSEGSVVNREVIADYYRMPVTFKIIGVVKDFYHYSKKRLVPPMMFVPLKNSFSVFRISVRSSDKGNWRSTESVVQKVLKENLTAAYAQRGIQVAFDVVDVESSYNAQYGRDEQLSRFLNALTFLAIVMAGIGFFSLSSSTTRKRTREIAIRKIFGAQAVDMSILLSAYFIKVAGAAFIVSLPVSYLLTEDWLSQFPARTKMDVWFVIWPMVTMLGLMLLSISYFILKLVVVNPIRHLRND